jgi:hypothetical protein
MVPGKVTSGKDTNALQMAKSCSWSSKFLTPPRDQFTNSFMNSSRRVDLSKIADHKFPIRAPSSRTRRLAHSSRSECIDAGHGVKAFGNERNLPWLWVMLPSATHWLQERQNRPIGSNQLI